MRLRHPCPLPLSVWQSEIAIDNRDGIRPNRLNPIVLPWQSRWNRRFDRIIGNTDLELEAPSIYANIDTHETL